MAKRIRHAVNPRAIRIEYRGGLIVAYPATCEYYPSFDGVAIFGDYVSETQAQAAIDERRHYLIEAGQLLPDQVDIFAA